MLVTTWLACSAPAPAPAPAPPAAPAPAPAPAVELTGTGLAWVSEATGAPAVRWAPSGGPTVAVPGLGDRPAFPAEPDPRGTHLLAVTSEDGPEGHRERLLLAPLTGGEPRELASAQMVRNPRWLPDGSAIVYESDAQSFRDLYRTPRDGGPPTRLTTSEFGCFEPAVSFDGQWLAWGASTDGNAEIWVARSDGSAPRRLTTEPTDDTAPAFLPDGRISWIATRGGLPRVWVSDLSGADARPLRPDATGAELAVAWSSAGVAAVTVSPAPREVDLALVRADGALLAAVAGPGPDEHPAFSPDGAALAFSSARDGAVGVWVARVDGSALRKVSAGPGPDWLPRWLPAPRVTD